MKNLMLAILVSTVAISPSVFGSTNLNPSEEAGISRHKKIYTFQHKLIPRLLHETDGRFFTDLKLGKESKLIGIAEKFVDVDFANAIKITAVLEDQAYALTFQTPTQPPECYHALIVKVENDHLYYTLEKGLDFSERGRPSVLCSWTKEGTHQNLGTRKYDDLDSFINDIILTKNDG
jgi:hypothetical protein